MPKTPENLPEEAKDLLEELGKYKALDVLKNTEGGELLIATLRASIVSEVGTLIAGYKDMPEIEIRARLAKISAFVPLVQSLVRAKTNAEGLAEDLKNLTE